MSKAVNGDPQKDVEVKRIIEDMHRLLVNKRDMDLLKNSNRDLCRKLAVIAKQVAARADDFCSIRFEQITNVKGGGSKKKKDKPQSEEDIRRNN